MLDLYSRQGGPTSAEVDQASIFFIFRDKKMEMTLFLVLECAR